jgi:hypothetical protein
MQAAEFRERLQGAQAAIESAEKIVADGAEPMPEPALASA